MFNIPSFFGFRAGDYVRLPLLDVYPNAAAAYSLRLLDSTYLGSAIQVRESTNNTTLDIGFVDGELDTASLLAHCAGANGFVTEWYDQSGNARNATQGVALNQPQIVSSGSVILENGKPTLQFDAVNDKLDIGTIISDFINNPISVFTTMKSNNNTPQGIAYNISNGIQIVNLSFNRTTGHAVALNLRLLGTQLKGGLSLNDQILYTLITTSTPTTAYFEDGVEITTNSNGRSTLINSIGGNFFLSMQFQEHIIYELNQSTNRTGIEDNINNFYSIF